MTEPSTPKKRTCYYIEGNTLKAFNQICKREGVKPSHKIEEFIQRYNAVHSEGNPQLALTKFTESLEAKKTCFFCQGHYPALKKVEFVSGLIAPTCSVCLEQKRAARLVKRVKGDAWNRRVRVAKQSRALRAIHVQPGPAISWDYSAPWHRCWW